MGKHIEITEDNIKNYYMKEVIEISELLTEMGVSHSNGSSKIFTEGLEYMIEVESENKIKVYFYDKLVLQGNLEKVKKYFTDEMPPKVVQNRKTEDEE